MRRSLFILLVLGLLASYCYGETRWCSIIGRGPKDALIYPPFARLARIGGVTAVRVFYSPNGKVTKLDEVSGPPVLLASLSEQIKAWTIHTDASGDDLCQTLIVVNFTILRFDPAYRRKPEKLVAPSLLELSIEIEPLPISVDVD